MIDKSIQSVASDWAEKIIHNMFLSVNPEYKLEGEALEIYNNLKEWGWFDLHPLTVDEGEDSTRLLLTMNKYAKIKWAKDHPPRKKPSKWEMVTGKARKKR